MPTNSFQNQKLVDKCAAIEAAIRKQDPKASTREAIEKKVQGGLGKDVKAQLQDAAIKQQVAQQYAQEHMQRMRAVLSDYEQKHLESSVGKFLDLMADYGWALRGVSAEPDWDEVRPELYPDLAMYWLVVDYAQAAGLRGTKLSRASTASQRKGSGKRRRR